MSVRAWRAGIRKELLLLSRDWHALALLFVMPLAFLLVMSLALQDQFAEHAGKKIGVIVVDRDASAASKALLAELQTSHAAEIRSSDAPTFDALKAELRATRSAFALEIAKGYGASLSDAKAALTERVTLLVAPDTTKQTELIFEGTLRELLARERLSALLAPFMLLSRAQGSDLSFDAQSTQPKVEYLYRANATARAPSAVQQNVPAWLVFGAFFIVIPLSNTLIRERQQGTARRLRTMPVGNGTLLAGKLLPYFFVNQLQVALMVLAGCFLVPALGGEALQLNGSLVALIAVGCAVSFAAIGYALLIASITRTTEQATLLGGAGNLILAAVGGIMVPKFVMPEGMQHFANVSPMSWGLEGFLDVLLRDATLREVAGNVGALLAFGATALTLAWWAQSRTEN